MKDIGTVREVLLRVETTHRDAAPEAGWRYSNGMISYEEPTPTFIRKLGALLRSLGGRYAH